MSLLQVLLLNIHTIGYTHLLFSQFPSYDRKDNASIETFVLIVALEATNSNSVCNLRHSLTKQT